MHTITSGEDAANQINLSLGLPNGSYDARARVTDTVGTGLTSSWSNIVTNFTISGAVVPFAITYVSNTGNTSSTAGTGFTFTSMNIGTADPTRIVGVAIFGNSTGVSVSSVTVGGNSATQATGATGNTAVGASVDFWYCPLASGTSGNIVVTWGASQARCGIVVYSITGTGAAFGTAVSATISSGTTINATRSVPTGGGAIALASLHGGTIGSVTNGGNITTIDQNGVQIAATANLMAAGHNTSASGSTTFTFNWTTSADVAMSVVTFSP
jgi:hypothetical protein